MVQSWVQDQAVEQAVRRVEVVSAVVLSEADVDHTASVVWPQIKRLLICFNGFFGPQLLGECGSVLVPKRVVSWVFFDTFKEVPSCLFEVGLDETKDT